MDEVPRDDEDGPVGVARSGIFEDRRHPVEILDVALHVGGNEEPAPIGELTMHRTQHDRGTSTSWTAKSLRDERAQRSPVSWARRALRQREYEIAPHRERRTSLPGVTLRCSAAQLGAPRGRAEAPRLP